MTYKFLRVLGGAEFLPRAKARGFLRGLPVTMRRLLARRRARRAVVLAAKCVELGYEPSLAHEHDPDDLNDLRRSVRALRELEG